MSASIPGWDETGNLPPGIHWASWSELAERFGTTEHRRTLLEGLKEALSSLRAAGCRRAYQVDKETGRPKGIVGLDLTGWEP